ncbi:conserved hypothetical protein [Arthrobacter sp. Hiyo8]|nr:conserved hypothetical protein [Arthrobacter sp. Hiyo8]
MRRLRRTIILLLALALVAGAIYAVVTVLQRSETLVTERCVAVVGSDSYELATDQAANAALITAIAVQRGCLRARPQSPWPQPCRNPSFATSDTVTRLAPIRGPVPAAPLPGLGHRSRGHGSCLRDERFL